MEYALIALYMIAGTVGLLWLVWHLNKGLSILDVVLDVAFGWAVGVPFLVIAAVAWLLSQQGAEWITRKRWLRREI